jgi:hypothetical protein
VLHLIEVLVPLGLIVLLLYWGFCDYRSGYPRVTKPPTNNKED